MGFQQYDPHCPDLRARVVDAMRALSVDGYALDQGVWDKQRPAGLPASKWIHTHWSWREIRIEAGLRATGKQKVRRDGGDDLGRPLEPWECIGVPEFMQALPGGLPVCDVPRDLGSGRVAWMVR